MVHKAWVGVLLVAGVVTADFYDVISPYLQPPAGGCKAWSDAPEYDKYWVHGKPPADAGANCAQMGKGNPMNANAHTASAYCVSKTSGKLEFCTSATGVPEQINIQIASPDTVVVSFVTFETSPPAVPLVEMGTESGKLTNTVRGVTHLHHTAAKDRTYYMHFVRVQGLSPRATYFYKVNSGISGGKWSPEFSFRAPYASGETRVALFGDMGVYTYNNMGNLWNDTVKEKSMDLIILAGDHCYNEGDEDEKRADGYLQAFQQTLANVPWMPIVGNHEFYADAHLYRYLNQTWEGWESPQWGSDRLESTATSAMGAFLSAGNHHSAAWHSTVPSYTSRYFSVDFGLLHLIALNLNGYYGTDLCTDVCIKQQKEWLRKDLSQVNRTATPWVVAMAHYPLYTEEDKEISSQPLAQQPWNVAEECEYLGHRETCRPQGWQPSNLTYTIGDAIEDLEPLMYEFGVDIFWAGHVHYYQTFTGPLRNGKVVSKGTVNPKGVINVVTGNGGPPSPTPCNKKDEYCSSDYSYTRMTALNTTHLKWEQVRNNDSTVFHSWVLVQENHGPFPTM